MDEELEARSLQIDFYKELQSGITVNGINFTAPSGTNTHIEDQIQAQKANQLVDYIIKLGAYKFDLDWVQQHFNDWGGLANRTPATKGAYLKRYLDSEDFVYVGRVQEILESESGQAGFDEMLLNAGGATRVQAYFQAVQARMGPLFQRFTSPIQALEKKFNHKLL